MPQTPHSAVYLSPFFALLTVSRKVAVNAAKLGTKDFEKRL
ncbi:MAG: hypothetical protein JWO06_2987 [Bacteroidota bacterium]|nr:hypothetical protein [Bacteroidota bacterium]